MKTSRYTHGMLLIEVVIAALLVFVVATALLAVVGMTYDARSTITGQNTADAGARIAMDALADNLRNAQSNPSSLNAVFAAASTSDVTLYTLSYNYANTPPTAVYGTLRYWRNTANSPATLSKTTIQNGVTTTTTEALGLQSFQLTYYKSGGVYTPVASSWTTTTDPHNPTTAELPLVGAVGISATITTPDSYTRQLYTFVRLRNSPLKTSL